MINSVDRVPAKSRMPMQPGDATGAPWAGVKVLSSFVSFSLSDLTRKQYLLSALEKETGSEPIKLKVLQTLISESRPSKSKWASEERVGQEALYEGCERVLNSLRNYTV